MATQWLRLWHEMPNDPKWRTVARKSGQPVSAVLAVYLHMLVNASMSQQRGTLERWEDEDVASALDLDESAVASIREAMQGRVLEGFALTGWERRQPAREESDSATSSTERSRRHRARQRQEEAQRNAMQRNATQEDAQDKDTDTDTEGERETPAARSAPRRAPALGEDDEQGTAVPDSFAPDKSHVALANSLGLDLRAERDKFVDHYTATGEVLADWPAKFRNWLRRAHKHGDSRYQRSGGPGGKQGAAPPQAQDKPWFLVASKIEEKAREIGYTPPRDIPLGAWKVAVYRKVGLRYDEYRKAVIDYGGTPEPSWE